MADCSGERGERGERVGDSSGGDGDTDLAWLACMARLRSARSPGALICEDVSEASPGEPPPPPPPPPPPLVHGDAQLIERVDTELLYIADPGPRDERVASRVLFPLSV